MESREPEGPGKDAVTDAFVGFIGDVEALASFPSNPVEEVCCRICSDKGPEVKSASDRRRTQS
jgi:hypothetical protein